MNTTCSFCHGAPVGNAATWVDGQERPPAACPRCGETNTDNPAVTGRLRPAESARERVERASAEAKRARIDAVFNALDDADLIVPGRRIQTIKVLSEVL